MASPSLPSKDKPVLVYSNQGGDNLKNVFLRAILSTKKELYLQIYGLTDPDIIKAIACTKQKTGNVYVLFDPSGSKKLQDHLPFASPVKTSGLMHKKILIQDDKNIFIGTANLTPTSLCMHDNVVIGMQSRELANFLLYTPLQTFSFMAGQQPGEFWHLPDTKDRCLQKVLSLLEKAEKSITLSLFTFTHPDIISTLLDAKKRGVKVEVALDFYATRGASKKAMALLEKEEIPLLISQGTKLLHHKLCLIDNETLLVGSANWTKAAFKKNEDCLLILYSLTKEQRNHFDKIWKDIKLNSKQK